MYDKIYEIIQSADDFVWGWGMIALLLGTHLFLTVRTGLIQRKTITKGIRLSVAKEEGADGEVSQFGALATALASTIGTGNIIGVGSCILVLDHGHFRNCNEVCRIAYCGKVQSKNRRRANAGRCDVCAGARTEYEVARFGVRFFGRFCFFWNRMRDSGKRDRGSVQ